MKHTEPGETSTFLIREGVDKYTKITGDFKDGEITGFGVKNWSSGKYYEGQFLEGEMHGQGTLVYNNPSQRFKDAQYVGEFVLNSREG